MGKTVAPPEVWAEINAQLDEWEAAFIRAMEAELGLGEQQKGDDRGRQEPAISKE